MSNFKVGDQVVCLNNGGNMLTVGKKYEVVGVDLHQVGVVNDLGKVSYYYTSRFELVFKLVEDEKQSTSAWLKENKWFIRTGSPEKSKLVQEWLFEHGCEWLYGKSKLSNFNEKYLTNTSDTGKLSKYIMHGNSDKTNAQEIKIEYSTVVASVKLPEDPKPTEQQLKIEQLQATIDKAQKELKELKELK